MWPMRRYVKSTRYVNENGDLGSKRKADLSKNMSPAVREPGTTDRVKM